MGCSLVASYFGLPLPLSIMINTAKIRIRFCAIKHFGIIIHENEKNWKYNYLTVNRIQSEKCQKSMMKTWIKKRWLSSQTAIQYIQNNALTSYGRESGAKIMTLSYLLNINSYFFKTFFQIKGHVWERAENRCQFLKAYFPNQANDFCPSISLKPKTVLRGNEDSSRRQRE